MYANSRVQARRCALWYLVARINLGVLGRCYTAAGNNNVRRLQPRRTGILMRVPLAVLLRCHRAVRSRLRLSKAFRPCARRVAGIIIRRRSAIVPCRAVPAVAVSL